MDIKDIKDLIITIDKTTIKEVEIEKNDFKIMISKGIDSEENISKLVNIDSLQGSNIDEKTIDNINIIESEIDKDESGEILVDDNSSIVKSPIVGTFYRAPSPDSPPFVNVGDTVEKGQTLCIIEAMKIMNEIESEYEGEIVEIFVENEEIVEFGQPLMLIRR